MPKLSFCIPTYNRLSPLKKLVQEILACDNPDIEVIVSDNCSTDDTLNWLATIDDKRLFVYSSKTNQGSLFNGLNVLSKAQGQYVYFTTDKDFINRENINTFITFLAKNNDISCGYCKYFPPHHTENEIFFKGFEAISKVGYMGRHPSGYFFKKDILESIDYTAKLAEKDFVGEFVFDFIFAELALKGNAAIFNKELTIPQPNSEAAKDKSLSIKGVNTNAYYTPSSRLKMTINHTKHINQLEQLSADEKKRLILDVFIRGLMNATLGYRSILKNTGICEHYHLEPRNIGLLETIYTACKFSTEYYNNAELDREKNHLNKILFSFYLAKILFRKIIKKLSRRVLA